MEMEGVQDKGRGLVGAGLVPGAIVSYVSRWRPRTRGVSHDSWMPPTFLFTHSLVLTALPSLLSPPSPPPVPSCVFGLRVRTSAAAGAVRQRRRGCGVGQRGHSQVSTAHTCPTWRQGEVGPDTPVSSCISMPSRMAENLNMAIKNWR